MFSSSNRTRTNEIIQVSKQSDAGGSDPTGWPTWHPPSYETHCAGGSSFGPPIGRPQARTACFPPKRLELATGLWPRKRDRLPRQPTGVSHPLGRLCPPFEGTAHRQHIGIVGTNGTMPTRTSGEIPEAAGALLPTVTPTGKLIIRDSVPQGHASSRQRRAGTNPIPRHVLVVQVAFFFWQAPTFQLRRAADRTRYGCGGITS